MLPNALSNNFNVIPLFLSVPVFGLDVVCHSLGFLIAMVVVVRVIRRSDVVHSVAATTFRASFEWSLAGHLIASMVSQAVLRKSMSLHLESMLVGKGYEESETYHKPLNDV
jgi:hypothetical protein